MTVGNLIESLGTFGPIDWRNLLGPKGGVLTAWHADPGEAAVEQWAQAYDRALEVKSDLAGYLSRLKEPMDPNRLYRNLCALLAIRADQMNDARRYVEEGQALHWSRSHRERAQARANTIKVPAGMSLSSGAGAIVHFLLSSLNDGPAGVWEDPEVAMTLLTPELRETIVGVAPGEKAFSWGLALDRDFTDVALSGDSCGGALRLGFQVLAQERSYNRDYLVLADREFKAVGDLGQKIDAAYHSHGEIHHVLLGHGSKVEESQRKAWGRRVELTWIDSEDEAFSYVSGELFVPAAPVEADSGLLGVIKGKCPYVGPQPFSIDDAATYHRSRQDWSDPVSRLKKPGAAVMLYAASGAGKSSLINTSLRSELKDIEVLPVARVAGAAAVASGVNPFTAAAIASMDPPPIVGNVRSWRELFTALPPRPKGRLLVIDQLEEIVTDRRFGDTAKQMFFGELRNALADDPTLRVLFSFREDWLGPIEGLIRDYDSNFFNRIHRCRLPKFRFTDAKIAIELAARTYGVRYEYDVLSALITELRRRDRDEPAGAGQSELSEYVQPLQLQIVCTLLWNKLPDWAKTISMQQVREAVKEEPPLGSPVATLVATANDNFCAQVIEQAAASGIIPGAGAYPRELIRLGLAQFVDGGKYRVAVVEGGDFTGELPTAVVEAMARGLLLTRKNLPGHRMFELAHDRLVGPVANRTDVSTKELCKLFHDKVAEAADECGMDSGLLTEECLLAFISAEGARLAITQDAEEESRWLPRRALECLLHSGILRRARENPNSGLELSHPAVAMALLPARNEAVGPRYRVRRNLSHSLEAARRDWGPELRGYFPDPDIARDVQEHLGFDRLSISEAALVTRASLCSDDLWESVVIRCAAQYPISTASVLTDAVKFEKSDVVRANAAHALAEVTVEGRIHILLEMSVGDESSAVRQAAAFSLATIDAKECWDQFLPLLSNPKTAQRAAAAIAWVRDCVQTPVRFFTWWEALPRTQRRAIDRSLRRVRVEGAFSRIAVGTSIALASTVAFVAPVRGLFGMGGYTITQLSTAGLNGLAESGFLGIIGGVIWSLLIATFLLSWWYIVEGRQPLRARNAGFRAAIVAGLAGLLGGALISLAITYIYGPGNLQTMKWLTSKNLLDSVTKTGMGLGMPLAGLLVGAGSGITLIRILPHWDHLLAARVAPRASAMRLTAIYGEACKLSLSNGARILLPLILGSVFFERYVHLRTDAHDPAFLSRLGDYKDMTLLYRLLGDYVDISLGGIGLVAGVLIALFVIGRGFERGAIKVASHPEYSLLRRTFPGVSVKERV